MCLLQINIWTTFAATGNPNCWHTDGCDWLPAAQDGSDKPLYCLNFNETCNVMQLPEMERANFWDQMEPY